MSPHRRLAKLEAVCGRPGQPCPDPRPAVIVSYPEGEPVPELWAEAEDLGEASSGEPDRDGGP